MDRFFGASDNTESVKELLQIGVQKNANNYRHFYATTSDESAVANELRTITESWRFFSRLDCLYTFLFSF